MQKITLEQFGADVKKKYPQYSQLSDTEVAQKTLQKYPQYQEMIDTTSNMSTPTGPVQATNNIPQPKKQGFLETLAKPFTKSIASVANLAETGYDVLKGDMQEAGRDIIKERNFGVFGKSRPIGVSQTQPETPMTAGQLAKDVVGTGAELASWAVPASVGRGIVAGAAPTVAGLAGAGATSGFLGSGGNALQNAKTLKEGLTQTAIGTTLGGIAAPVVGKGLQALTSKLAPKVASTADNIAGIADDLTPPPAGPTGAIADNIPTAPNPRKSVMGSAYDATKTNISGLKEKTAEQLRKIPTAFERANASIAESASKAERIKNATPAVAKALKSNLDDGLITTIEQADDATSKGFKKMVDIAKSKSKSIRPEKIAGDAAADQYKLVDKELKNIGSQIGDEVSKLSKSTKINLSDTITQLKTIVSNELPNLTPQERTQVQQLLELAIEQGDNLTPLQIYNKNKLFSKLQREARFDGLGNIMVETPNGTQNIFSLFKSLFANKLDDVSPKIKGLNKQYKNLIDIIESVEDTMLRGADKTSAKGLDPADFIQTRLRSLLSDNQSRPVLQNVVDMLDEKARSLGYTGAKAYDLIDFATILRDLYPETVPKTSLSGILKTKGVSGVAGEVLDYGSMGVKEQQEALEELLSEMVNKNALSGLKKQATKLSYEGVENIYPIGKVQDVEPNFLILKDGSESINFSKAKVGDVVSVDKGDEYLITNINKNGTVSVLHKDNYPMNKVGRADVDEIIINEVPENAKETFRLIGKKPQREILPTKSVEQSSSSYKLNAGEDIVNVKVGKNGAFSSKDDWDLYRNGKAIDNEFDNVKVGDKIGGRGLGMGTFKVVKIFKNGDIILSSNK